MLRIARSDKSDAILGLSSLGIRTPYPGWLLNGRGVSDRAGRLSLPGFRPRPLAAGEGAWARRRGKRALLPAAYRRLRSEAADFAPVVRCGDFPPRHQIKTGQKEVKHGLLKQSQEDRASVVKLHCGSRLQVRDVFGKPPCTWKDHMLRYIVTAKKIYGKQFDNVYTTKHPSYLP